MACHELAALRLGLMKLIGIDDEAEKEHELAELGDGANQPGPIKEMLQAGSIQSLCKQYENALAALEEKIAKMPASDVNLPYYRSLMILTKKVELDLRSQRESLTRLYGDLEEMHDFVHEIYPVN